MIAAFLLYLIAAACFIAYERSLSVSERENERMARAGFWFLLAALAVQFIETGLAASAGHIPFADRKSALGGLAIAWVLIGLVFIRSLRVPLLGAIVAPLAAVMLAIIIGGPDRPPVIRSEETKLIEGVGVVIHAFLGYTGYGAFFAASLGAGLFLLLDRELRLKRMSALLDRLPPLGRAARIMKIGVICGLLLMASAVACAAAFLRHSVPHAKLAADPNIRALFGICVYAALLWLAAWRLGWQRKRIAIGSFLLGVVVILIHAVFIFIGNFHDFS